MLSIASLRLSLQRVGRTFRKAPPENVVGGSMIGILLLGAFLFYGWGGHADGNQWGIGGMGDVYVHDHYDGQCLGFADEGMAWSPPSSLLSLSLGSGGHSGRDYLSRGGKRQTVIRAFHFPCEQGQAFSGLLDPERVQFLGEVALVAREAIGRKHALAGACHNQRGRGVRLADLRWEDAGSSGETRAETSSAAGGPGSAGHSAGCPKPNLH